MSLWNFDALADPKLLKGNITNVIEASHTEVNPVLIYYDFTRNIGVLAEAVVTMVSVSKGQRSAQPPVSVCVNGVFNVSAITAWECLSARAALRDGTAV